MRAIFEIIDTPVAESSGINCLETQRSWVTGASFCSSIAEGQVLTAPHRSNEWMEGVPIYADLEAQVVNLGRQTVDAVGKLRKVGQNPLRTPISTTYLGPSILWKAITSIYNCIFGEVEH